MLELKELFKAPRKSRVQKLNQDELSELGDDKLQKKLEKLERKNHKLLDLYKYADLNPRYFEELEEHLRRREVWKAYNRQFNN